MPARNFSTQMCFVARTTTVKPVVTFGFLWKRTIFVEHLLESAKKGKVCLHLSQSCAEKQVSGNFLSISDASSPDPRNLFFFTFVHIYLHTTNSTTTTTVKKMIFMNTTINLQMPSNNIGNPPWLNILEEIVASNKGKLMAGDFLRDAHYIQGSVRSYWLDHLDPLYQSWCLWTVINVPFVIFSSLIYFPSDIISLPSVPA